MVSDPHLLAAIASGSTEALGELYDAHARIVFGLAKRILGKTEDAEEVAQDVFAQVWRDAKKYEQGRATVAGWLVMLTRTRAIDKLRACKARPDLDQAHDPVPILQASLSKSLTPEAHEHLADAIAKEPPADLRAKIVNQAKASAAVTRSPRSTQGSSSDRPSNSAIVPWMIAAASIALVAATGFYGLMQRQQTATALAGKAAADARVSSLQRQILGLSERLAVLSAPDAVQIKLAGQPDAPGATASVVMSPTKGMVLTARNLPQLATGTIYQLWVVTKTAPVSIGTFEVAADGSVTGTMPLTPGASTDPVAVAVTIEPAGGVPSPTGPKVLVGLLAPQ